MLSLLDKLLLDILVSGVTALASPAAAAQDSQVGFEPPDDKWKSYVTGMKLMALNLFLIDLRENTRLRSDERTRHYENGMVIDEPAPVRVACHYLMSAWSPIEFSPSATPIVEPTLDEHALLYEAAAVLVNQAPFNPSRVYTPGTNQIRVWEPYDQMDLPTQIAPAEGSPKLAEFWGAMGQASRWKPTLYLVVTIPVALLRQTSGPPVTTLTTTYGVTGYMQDSESIIQIGGHITRLINNTPIPVQGATVALETTGGELLQWTRTNALGQFVMDRLSPGQYQLKASAAGLGEKTRSNVEVPSPSGEYDLQFP